MSAGAQQITPLVFASDVLHFSGSDILTAPAISNTTRALSARDNTLAAKINQLIGFANNAAQYVSIPTYRTSLNGMESGTISNFRIPSGYEARLLNATCWTSLPTSGTLTISHGAATFGATTGTSLCTVTDIAEFTAGSSWYGVGEFITTVANTQPHRIDIASSALVSIRPVGFQGGDVVGPGGVTTQGIPGPIGDTGKEGPPGGIGGNVIQIGSNARFVAIVGPPSGVVLQISPDGVTWTNEIEWLEPS